MVKKSLSLFRERSLTRHGHYSKSYKQQGQTLSLVAVLGSMTLRMSRVSWVREVPMWPCFMTKDLGTLAVDDSWDRFPFK